MAYRSRRRGLVISAVAVGLLLAAHNNSHGGSFLASRAMPAPHGGTLSCSGLESLWESAGGSPGSAFMAAEIAKAESGGHQYSTDLNGGASTDRGYFQINSTWGALSTYNPLGNAKAAVAISHDGQDWSPWVTFNSGAYKGQC